MKWRPPPSTLFPYTTLFRSTAVRTAVHGLCTNCSRLPIFVNEYNAGPGWAPSNFAGSYDNAVFLARSEEHTSELQSHVNLVCRLLLEKKNQPPTSAASPHPR